LRRSFATAASPRSSPKGLRRTRRTWRHSRRAPARIALQAEADAGFTLGLVILPVGLRFEPRRQFRGDAFVRVGEPLTIGDLAARYADDPREAAGDLTERITAAVRRVAYRVESTARIPFIERLVDVYLSRARRTGIAGVRGSAVRGELKQKAAACLNHYAVVDPEAVAEVERELKRYERLRDAAGVGPTAARGTGAPPSWTARLRAGGRRGGARRASGAFRIRDRRRAVLPDEADRGTRQPS
jgi:hypothetical protein